MIKCNYELRMYFFVPYNISDIQKGIQAGHAVLEYTNLFGRTKLYIDFLDYYKTWIILNGGTTRSSGKNIGTMNEIENSLYENKINYARFEEPDLEYALTALCFICDERVWNIEKYPDSILNKKNLFLRQLIQDKHLA